jgi:hypothetical protein
MNPFKSITILMIFLVIAFACTKEVDNLKELDSVTAPANISATFDITQDNTGLVTIIPRGEGVTAYKVTFGDVAGEIPTEYAVNETITHNYAEGVFEVDITAVGLSGLTTTFTQEINVTFIAPENLVVTIIQDLANPNFVSVSAIADFASIMDIYFGDQPYEIPVHALPEEVVTHTYTEVGDYIITVIAKSGGAATTEYNDTITVYELTGPQMAAPAPPGRVPTDVISIFSGAYTDILNTNFNPNWGQSTVVSFEEIAGDNTLKYSNLNYQGTQFENPIDASAMEYLHLDMWTDDATAINIYMISTGPAETPYALTITSTEWVSYDIPLTAFSNVVDLTDVIQFKFDGTIGSNIYLDNIYIYRQGASTEPSLPLDFESSTINYEWINFDGGVVTVIDNPQSNGINTSAKVAQMVKNAGQTWGGSWIGLDAPIDFSVNKTFKMKVFSPRVGAKVLLKVENMTTASIFYEVEELTTVEDTWEEITFDYSGISTTESYQKLVIIFDNGTVGNGSPDFTFLFDDIELTN